MSSKRNSPFDSLFGDVDLTKLMSDFKIPAFNVQAVMNTHQKNLEAMTSAGQLAIEGVQEMAKRQGEILRQGVEEFSGVTSNTTAFGTVEEKTVHNAEILKVVFQSTLANMWDLGDLATKTTTKSFGVINKRVAESLDEVQEYFPVEKTAKAGSTSQAA